jgi:hypothetical protein
MTGSKKRGRATLNREPSPGEATTNQARDRATILQITARGSAVQQNPVQIRTGVFAGRKKPKPAYDELRRWTREQGRQTIVAKVKLKKGDFVKACLDYFDDTCTKDKAETAFERWMQKKAKYGRRARRRRPATSR